MKNLQTEDLQRLATEIGFTTEDAEDWAKRSDFPYTVVEDVGNVGANLVLRKMFEEGQDQLDADPDDPVEINLPAMIAGACISAFVLGFETHKQFGDIQDDESS